MTRTTYARPDPLAAKGFFILDNDRKEIDWDHVAHAFRAANQAVGWGADITLTPERRHVLVCFPRERAAHVENTIAIFYRVIERHIGFDAFRLIGIDLEPRSASPGPLISSDVQRTR
jgi:hypothetical protein